MAHYAFLDTNYIVTDVIVGRDESNFDWEAYYGGLRGMVCKRTSYNTCGNVHTGGGTPFRKNYAGIGFSYNTDLDAFIPPQPYPSWLLNTDTGLWYPPVPYPDDGNEYEWDEATQSWIPVNPPAPTPPYTPVQPYPSWTYDPATDSWQPPVPQPNDGKRYYWDESTLSWKEGTPP